MCICCHKLCNSKTGVGSTFTWSNEPWFREKTYNTDDTDDTEYTEYTDDTDDTDYTDYTDYADDTDVTDDTDDTDDLVKRQMWMCECECVNDVPAG